MDINVGFLLSYDYELLKQSLPLVYKYCDSIVLALDENRNTWAGNTIDIPKEFFDWVSNFDKNHKISIYEDNFYDPTLTTMQNETRERNMLAKKMGKGLCLQIDVDEYHVNFKGLVHYLKQHEKKLTSSKKYQICIPSVDLFKVFDDGVLCISDFSMFNSGSNHPEFTMGRKCKNQQKLYVPFYFIHQSWGRTANDLYLKLKNWGHNEDFDVDTYFSFWKSITKQNYKDHKNFHPLNGKSWKKLEYIEGDTIQKNVSNIRAQKNISSFFIFKKNLGQSLKFLFK